ncbi:unnamed protein product, partial [Tilletia controversa]
MYQCRCCNKAVKVTDGKISALALHFNPTSTSYCKRKFTPLDRGMLGVFDNDRDAPSKKVVPSADATSHGGAASNIGSFHTQSVEQWLDAGKRRAHKMLVAVVRRRSIAWIIGESLPFTILQSRSFLDMIEAVTPAALPAFKSARQVKRDIGVVSLNLFDQAISALSKTSFSMQLDEWTTPGMQHAFQALVLTHIDQEWQYHSYCIDFQVLRGRHSGSTFAGHVVSFLTDNGLTDNWNGVITTDSASSNTRMSTLIERKLETEKVKLKNPFVARTSHIRCFAHHLNLVVQTMCIAFGVPREESSRQSKIVVPVGGVVEDEDPEDEHRDLPVVGDWDEAEKELESAAGGKTEKTERNLPPVLVAIPEEEDEDREDPEDPDAGAAAHGGVQGSDTQSTTGPDPAPPPPSGQLPGYGQEKGYLSPLTKIATIVKIARSSPERRRKYLRKAREAYNGNKIMADAVLVPPAFNKTRWNSRYFQLHSALKYAKGLVYVVRSDEEGVYDINLNINADEIKLLKKVTDILTYFLTLIKSVEREAPTAADILRYHGDLAHALKVECDEARQLNNEVGTFFANALQLGMDKLAVYRERASQYDPLLLAAILDPKYRLAILLKDYSSATVARAKELLKIEVEKVIGSGSAPLRSTVFSPAGAAKPQWRRFSPPPEQNHTDEITAYLLGGFPFRSGETTLGWWRDNAKNLRVLSEVARRVLASAGSTAAVERVFSAAGRICTPRRRSIAPATI